LQNSSSHDDGKIGHGMLGKLSHVSMTQGLFKYLDIATTHATTSNAVDEGTIVSLTSSDMKLIGDGNGIDNTLLNLTINRYLIGVRCRSMNIPIGQHLA
jgi:hypothetical protein